MQPADRTVSRLQVGPDRRQVHHPFNVVRLDRLGARRAEAIWNPRTLSEP